MIKARFVFTKVLPVYAKYILAYLACVFGYAKSSDPIWLISERGVDARDNGYFFFKYLRKEQRHINCCYVINKRSADYSKVAEIGETIEYGSIKHYAMMMRAECLISSHIMGFTPEPEVFLILEKRGLLILPGKKIFLQHGIIKDDIEGLKFPHVKPDVFICGALAEYNFVRDNFRHPENVVQLTGLARYDTLLNEDNNSQILIMPTWRKWLNNLPKEKFAQSEYFQAYYELLADGEIQNWLKNAGLKIVFYPHYEMQKYIGLFEELESDVVKIARFEDYDVQTLLKQSSLLITDYSSVYFDFAFMNKPILFYQFDRKQFLLQHYQKGYFKESVFGEVATDYQIIKEKILASYNGKIFPKTFAQSQKRFFVGISNDCCKKIFCAIKQTLRK